MDKLEELLQAELASLMSHAKADYKDVQAWAQEIAKDMVTALRKGFKGATPELQNQAILVAELSRIRLNRELKSRIRAFVGTAVKVAASLL